MILAALLTLAVPHAAVTGGRVVGERAADRLIFRGIPFAAPPLADRRWRAPQPVARWQGVRRAVDPAPACLQNDYGWNHGDHVFASEDCLTLDIASPALTGKRAVLVWIHGGSNRAGSPQGMVLSSIVAKGIVVVGIRYRLGVFGFLSHRNFGATAGNYALMDQIAALRWVQANIARFGGDPSQVTIAGESAGAQDVGLLMAAPEARGLFARAIMGSGTPEFGIAPRSIEEGYRIGDQLDAQLGGGDPLQASANALLAADLKLHDAHLTTDDYLWLRTTIDGAVLPKPPAALLAEAPPRPLLIGTNAVELDLPGGRAARDGFVARTYGPNEDRARTYYALGRADPPADPRLGTVDQRIATDATFGCPADRTAALVAAKGAAVYRYLFDGSPDGGMTSHATELQYIFGDARLNGIHLQDYWAAFIQTGTPAGWPLYPARLRFDARGATPETAAPAAICALSEAL